MGHSLSALLIRKSPFIYRKFINLYSSFGVFHGLLCYNIKYSFDIRNNLRKDGRP